MRRRAAERDVVGDAERARLRLEAIALRSFADDAEAPRHPKHRQRVEQHVKPLLLHQPPDGEHVQNAGGRSPFAGEPPHVDAVRHQIDARAAAVELGGDVGIARDDARGAARPIVQLRPIDFPRVTGVHAEAERHAERARQIGRDNGRGVREVRVHARDPHRVEPPSGVGGLFRRRAQQLAYAVTEAAYCRLRRPVFTRLRAEHCGEHAPVVERGELCESKRFRPARKAAHDDREPGRPHGVAVPSSAATRC